METSAKSSVEDIRARFDQEVERFSNISTGQIATVDAARCMELVAATAAAVTPRAVTALDVGCGAGNYSLKLRQYLPSIRLTLVDLSQPMLDRARQRLGQSVDRAVQTDIRNADFTAGQFDIILAAAVLHHLRTPQEWEAAFASFFRWLRVGGGLWIFDLVSHENQAVQRLLWSDYCRYLEAQGGADYREKVFAYIDREDTPTPLAWQLELLRKTGFAQADVLHKNSCFAAYGGTKLRDQ
jgi:tRNA (cmo5U34)-methyltransferase